MLNCKEAPKPWDIRVLFPGLSDDDIADKLAAYFNRISQEFQAISPLTKEIKNAPRSCPELYQIAARLKKMKKPNSQVAGDIPPTLISDLADFFAIPLHYIYGRVYDDLEWPELWKRETGPYHSKKLCSSRHEPA